MKSYFYRNINKIFVTAFLIVLMFGLTSCRGGAWSETVYTTWDAEFHFANFWEGLWGWPIAILSYPIAWLCSNIGRALGNSYAWGIIFTTIIVRTIAWPIYSKQNSTSVKMAMMQPELEKLQRKYAGRTDNESKQRMSQEQMALYKKYKMNPMGCMFTMLLQFPIFMSMYEVVRRINLTTTVSLDGGLVQVVERGRFALMDTKLFGFFELNCSFYDATTIQDKIFVAVLAVLFGAITFISQKLASKKPSYQKNRPSANPQADQQASTMRTMNMVMTFMFVFMSLSSASLALYWVIGGLYQMLQSYIGRRNNEKKYYKMKNKI